MASGTARLIALRRVRNLHQIIRNAEDTCLNSFDAGWWKDIIIVTTTHAPMAGKPTDNECFHFKIVASH